MIAANEYKRAAGMLEPQPSQPAAAMLPGDAMKLSWALSRIAPVPSPDLAQQLARALLAICTEDGAIALQVGRVTGDGFWRCEASGLAGRPERSGFTIDWRHTLPWPRPPATSDQSCYVVRQPQPGDPGMKPVEAAFNRVNLRPGLAALACTTRPGEIVVTVQLGSPRCGNEQVHAALLTQVLPWALSIARVAVGESEGQTPRAWLTQRERDVLEQLVGGASVVEIAKALDRSHYTVHDHVKSLHRKLGVKSRAALVGCATLGVPPPGVGDDASLDDPGHLR